MTRRRANWDPYSLTLDDYATTRLLERSRSTTTTWPTAWAFALRRHGATNVIRALSRAERAPTSIAAL